MARGSAYNRGCRCDDCREAARLARARQRASRSTPTALPSTVSEGPTVSYELLAVGALFGGTGVWTLWRGWKRFSSGEEYSSRWFAIGGALCATGCGLIIVGARQG